MYAINGVNGGGAYFICDRDVDLTQQRGQRATVQRQHTPRLAAPEHRHTGSGWSMQNRQVFTANEVRG